MTPKQLVLFNFSENADISNWRVVNDGVMGGLSQANFQLDAAGNAVYQGKVSLENNGGFSSVRYRFDSLPMADFQKVCIILKGDGKRYQFRLKSAVGDAHSYVQYFQTQREWEQIELNLADFYPTFRGRKLSMPNYPQQQLAEVAFLVGNKKAETFQLEIGEIFLQS